MRRGSSRSYSIRRAETRDCPACHGEQRLGTIGHVILSAETAGSRWPLIVAVQDGVGDAAEMLVGGGLGTVSVWARL